VAKLHLKLRTDANEAERQSAFRLARETGAQGIRPLFPEATDDDLASLITIDVSNETAVPKLLKALGAHKAVEFVEPEVRRKLKMR
jgi:hypothetical protein